MKKIYLLSLLLVCAFTSTMAQRISGTIIDRDTKEGVVQATVSLLKSDSTFVKGVISDTNGKFSVSAPSNGKFLLKITSVAYKTLIKPITISDGKDLALGKVTLDADAIMLKEAVATGQAARVTVKEDTFVYNAAAYHTPEGAVLEELVKRLPGAQVDEGKVKINGKEVKKILVDGKEFMTGDTETALKNLPTDIIDKIKAYDQKSDLARITGIDDGEEETVLDFGIKRGMNKGTMGNFDLGIGTKHRYSERGMLSYMKDDFRIMGMGSANNTGDMGFPGGGGGPRFGGGGNGLNSSKMLGFNINYEKVDVLKLDGSIRWNHRDGDTWQRSSTESFLADQKSFGNSISQSFSRSDQINFQMRLEWTPDSMTNIMFRPRISTSHNDNTSASENATFNDDPYLYVKSPLDDIALGQGSSELISLDKLVNSQLSNSLSYSTNDQYSAMAQYNRKLNKPGRNITVQLNGSYREGESTSNTLKNITTYDVINHIVDTTLTNRYNVAPTKNYSYSIRGTYSEPIAKTMYLQASYQFSYNKQKSDRSTYDYSSYIFPLSYLGQPEYRDWEKYLGGLEGYPNIARYRDDDLSKFSEYDTYTHRADLQIRKIGEKWNYTVGVMFQPQNSEMKYKYQGLDTIVKRSVFNVAPSIDLRYKISKVSQLRLQYNSNTSQPSMTDLLEVYDDADPLRITTGNAGLKPSFTHNMRLFYNGYDQWHTTSWMTFLNFNVTQNSVSQKVTYFNETTTLGGHTYLPGSQLTRPENINGNWGANAGLMFSCSIDSVGYWNVNTFTNFNFNNRTSFYNRRTSNMDQYGNPIYEELINTTRTTSVMERLGISYRNSWLEIEPNGNVNFTHTRNLLQDQNNLDTWSFNYGLNINLTAPWGTGFATDLHNNSRRGYNDDNLNTDEFVWNIQISQSFLKGRALTLSLQFYDILQNQSTLSRNISAMQRSDTEYNAINSYAMLHVIYRFNNFGGKHNRRGGMDGRPDFSDPRFSRGGQGGPPAGGFPGGGFGGGRPGGGFGGGGRF